MTRYSPTRRGVLAAVGAVAVSGCAGLFGNGEDEPTVDGTALDDLGPLPSVARPLPAAPDDEYFATARDRAESLLEAVPEELGAGEVPNEAVRDELVEVRDTSVEELQAGAEASSAAERLEQLRRARGSAANADAAWRSIDGDLDRATVRDRVAPIRSSLSEFRNRWQYVGDDPVRAVVVHETIESLLHQADVGTTDDVDANLHRPENAVTIGLLAGELERARAAVDDAAAVFDRFDASASGDVSGALESGSDELVSTLEDRVAGLPDGDPDEPSSFVESDVSDTPAGWALDRLYRAVDDVSWIRDAVEADRPASAVLRAHGYLARFEAFDALRERANDGETFEFSSADGVTARRAAAASAVEGALEETEQPLLARSELSALVEGMRYLDERLQGVGEEPSVASLVDNAGEYLVVEQTARSIPAADEAVAGILETAEDNP